MTRQRGIPTKKRKAKPGQTIFLTALLSIVTTSLFAQDLVELLPLAPGDLAASTVQPAQTMNIINRSRDDVSISWPLLPTTRLSETAHSYQALSREYWLTVSAAQLQQGVSFHTTAPGAVLKLTPENSVTATSRASASDSLAMNQFVITNAQGQRSPLAATLSRGATATELKTTPLSFSPGSLIAQLDNSQGEGRFILQSIAKMDPGQKYTLYVLDKNSHYLLSLQTSSDTVFSGQALQAKISLAGNGKKQSIDTMDIYLRRPDGKKLEVENYTVRNNMIEIKHILDKQLSAQTGLWELHVHINSTHNGLPLQRHAKTSFAYSRPNASLNKNVLIQKNDKAGQLKLTFSLTAATSGRYELRGTLFATDTNNQLVPVMYANSAGWRAAGNASLNLNFDLTKLDKTGPGTPFEIRDLRLLDQGRMMLLHRQQRALRLQ